jgi:hypothetical protein
MFVYSIHSYMILALGDRYDTMWRWVVDWEFIEKNSWRSINASNGLHFQEFLWIVWYWTYTALKKLLGVQIWT